MTFTVTITQGGSTAIGTCGELKVVTGQSASPAGNTAAATNTTPSLAITPNATGSWVYGSNLGLTGTYTANGSTTYELDHAGQGLEYVSMRTTSTTTASSPVTVGGTATVNSISIALLEILNSTGLAEDVSSPAGWASSTTSATSGAFLPPNGSLLVLMTQTNGAAGAVTVSITDTSGLSLVWTEQAKQNGAGNGYAGIWTAPMPATAATTPSALVVPSLAATQAATW